MKTMDAKMSIRTYSDIKKDATKIYEDLGVDMTTAINVFLRKSIEHQGFPFDVRNEVLKDEIVERIENIEKGDNLSRTFKTVDELFDYLNA